VTGGGLLEVGAAQADVVTGVAADQGAFGQPRLEVEHLAQFDFVRGGLVALDGRGLVRDGLEGGLGILHEGVFGQGGTGGQGKDQGGDGKGFLHGRSP
jgi:hypothetical protein